MKKLVFICLLFLTSCAGKQYSFNEGPPRIKCQPKSRIAVVGKPWEWSCTFAGDLNPYTNSLIGVEIVAFKRETFPQRSVVGAGLKRVYEYQSIFDVEYYLELTGNLPSGYGDNLGRPEILRPNDPTAPNEPIEGIEASLDGSFNLTIRFVEMIDYNAVKGEATVKQISSTKMNGKITCPQCMV